ncbi:hypothetical protein P3X46_017852 [Hevea brasiliensis]|uniref:RPM1 interacting protein 13 n=1 Tax=Hevea brasiliensis TaxID=3981 RepID=A0ABQ9LS38_HEVBR|nr:RPM1 interacting protein 13 isoform X1 [Hevea brasiliensis]KAJ9169690.1 hypothetical protein P3X46_017852 [Hevea brasiliensis]
MESNPVIFDISSDEESAFNEPRGGDDDHEWLTELLETVDKENADSDEVLVVGEYNPPKPKSKSKSSKPVKDVDDDDCVVLDGDPDKQVDVVDDAASDGDDVLVVGQKGQIACRDYPHPRHLCAKFPFGSTPHERHCDLCHCYVCDSIAPCAHWGTGVSIVDHCHATDKQEIWKSQRQSFRLGKNASVLVSKFPDARLPVAPPQFNQVAPLDIIQLAPNSVTQNQISRPTAIRACSSARLNAPNFISQSRNRRPGCAQGRNGFLPHSVSRQPVGIHNTAVVRNRGQQSVSSNTMFKRPGIIRGASAMNQSVYGSVNKMNCAPASHYTRNSVSMARTNAKNPSGWQDALPNMVPHAYAHPSPSQPNMGSATLNMVPPRPEVYSQPFPQSNHGQNIYQNQSQNVVNSSFPDFDYSWISNLSESNEQVSAENIHPHATGSNKEPTSVEQFSSYYAENTELHQKDHDYESWLFGQSDAVVSEDCVPADLNVFSSEPFAFDAGMLCFDFETYWNGLANV